MKTIILGVFLAFILINLQAQNYLISFAGSGSGTTVDSVNVENITQCTSLEFVGTDTLNLRSTLGIESTLLSKNLPLNIYPDPFPESASVEFISPVSGDATIEIFDNAGKNIIQAQVNLSRGLQKFQISGFNNGVYLINIRSKGYSYEGKLISNYNGAAMPMITYQGESKSFKKNLNLKITSSIVQMQYNAGDMLKITGISDIYRTAFMIVPTSSQTVTFNFTPCTDADWNNYTTVQIGTQIWMEENLKTTKYQDGSSIPNVPDSAAWRNETSGAYCNYHNDTLEGEVYGHLYNFYAVQDSRNACPAGWHVPSDEEWRTLANTLGDSTVAGQKMKENCTTRWAYDDTTWGTNTSGFTGLCANFRNSTGAWSLAPNNDHDTNYWTSTIDISSFAWFRGLRWCYIDLFRAPTIFTAGFSVRCIK